MNPPAPSRRYLRNLLSWRFEWVESRLFAQAADNGYGDITPAMARFYAHLAGRPMHMSDLARRLAISRQAVHKMAMDGVKAGYVEVLPSTESGRQKIIRFTDKGWAMAASATQELEAIESRLIDCIGAERLQQLKDILQLPWSEEEKARRS